MPKNGLLIGCHYCPKEFSSQSSRANHHKYFHAKMHKKYKGHRMVPEFVCKYCIRGFGSPRSRSNHESRCPCKPIIKPAIKSGFTKPKNHIFRIQKCQRIQ